MKTVMQNDEYPGFEVSAKSISKFIAAGNLFTLMLKNGKIMHYTARDKDSFMKWLLDNRILDIK